MFLLLILSLFVLFEILARISIWSHACFLDGCPINKGFQSRAALVAHIESFHLKFALQCPLCDKNTFKSNMGLLAHVKQKHHLESADYAAKLKAKKK